MTRPPLGTPQQIVALLGAIAAQVDAEPDEVLTDPEVRTAAEHLLNMLTMRLSETRPEGENHDDHDQRNHADWGNDAATTV